jgi:hypothetical protein
VADYLHLKAQATLLPHGILSEGRAILRGKLTTQATLLPRRALCEGEQNRAAERRPPYYRIKLCARGEQYCVVDYLYLEAQATLLPHGVLSEGRAILRGKSTTQATLLPRRALCEGRAKPRSRTQATLLPH